MLIYLEEITLSFIIYIYIYICIYMLIYETVSKERYEEKLILAKFATLATIISLTLYMHQTIAPNCAN